MRKINNKFIWEKSKLNNKGISIKFTTSKYCYIKPTMCSTWDNLFRKEYFNKSYKSYFVCTEKVFYWLWFRLILRVENEFLSIIDDNTWSFDEILDACYPTLGRGSDWSAIATRLKEQKLNKKD